MEEKNIEKKEEIKNEVQEVKRPWQGTVLAFMGTVIFICLQLIVFWELIKDFTFSNFYVFIFMLFIAITGILLSLSILKKDGGESLAISFFVLGIGVVASTVDLIKDLIELDFRGIIGTVILFYIPWSLTIYCLCHPFYGKKNEMDKLLNLLKKFPKELKKLLNIK